MRKPTSLTLSHRLLTSLSVAGSLSLLPHGAIGIAHAQTAAAGLAPVPAAGPAPTVAPAPPVPAAAPEGAATPAAAPVVASDQASPPAALAPAPAGDTPSSAGVSVAVPAESTTVAAPEPAAAAVVEPEKEEPTFKITGAPGQGLTVSTGDAFSLNIKSRIQVRYQVNMFEDDKKDTQSIANVGTARIWLGGNVYKPELTYLIQLAVAGKDYRDNATSPIFDAYMEWKAHRDFAVRAGQYFVPFDRLRTVREWGLQMTDRPRPIQEFTLDRDVGVTFFSEKFLGDSSPVAWYLSAFGGHGTNQVNPAAVGGLITGRLELRPLGPIDDDREGDLDRREKPGLAFGVGAAHNFKSNRLRGTTGATFVGGTTDDTHIAVDAVFKWMGFALEGEYLHKSTSTSAFVTEQADGSALTEYTREGAGWIAQASYAFNPPFEVVGRLSRLYYDDTLDPAFISEVKKRGSEVAGGVNYYFNGHRMKAQATWVARTSSKLDLGKADHSVVAQIDATF
jgi:phosphate-selective porin OprO and OprP